MTRHRLAAIAAVGTTLLFALVLPAGGLASTRQSARAASLAVPHGQQAGAAHRTRTFSFFARVVRSGPRGLLVRTRSGKRIFFSARELAHKAGPAKRHHKHRQRGGHHRGHHSKRGHHGRRRHRRARPGRVHGRMESTTSPPISINIVGLQPGVTIQITETVDSDGIVSITITLPPPAALSEQNATGTITERDSDAFTLHTRGGSELRLNMAPDALSALGLQVCDTAAVTYHQDADLLIADTVNVTGTSTSGDCHSGLPSAGDVTGTITSVSPSALTVATGDGSLSFVVPDTSTTDGFLVGDVVDVSYSTSQGTLEADDVEYVEQEATGVVTAVSSSAMTITDDTTHQPDTFLSSGGAADTLGFGTFDGVAVGDQVEVIYHVSSGHRVADLAVDNSWLDLGGLGGGY